VQGLIKGRESSVDFKEVDISRDRATADKYKIQATPTIIVFDPEGKQVKTFVGVPRESDLKAAINQAVGS
jgi:thioredoxin-like negative regulator of GroEL